MRLNLGGLNRCFEERPSCFHAYHLPASDLSRIGIWDGFILNIVNDLLGYLLHMEFRLTYRGRLKGNGNADEKHRIRQALNPQLKELWKQAPLKDYQDLLPGGKNEDRSPFIKHIGSHTFIPLVNATADLIAEIDITFLRPEAPGTLVSQSGDIDNRIKTLLDALRMPQHLGEIPRNVPASEIEGAFFSLLEDDSLITHLSITTDRLLEPICHHLEVLLIMHVKIKVTRATIDYFALGI